MTLVMYPSLAALVCLVMKGGLLCQRGSRPFGTDVYCYLFLSDVARQNGFRLPIKIPRYIGSGRYDMPPLFVVLWALVPRKILERYQWVPSVISKVLLVWVLSFSIGIGFWNVGLPLQDASYASLVGGLLYALSPLNRNCNRSNPSDFLFTPRATAAFLSATTAILSSFAALTGDRWLIGAAALVGGMSLLTAKFCFQALSFSLPIAALLSRNPTYVEILLLAYTFAALATRGRWCFITWSSVKYLALHLFPGQGVFFSWVQSAICGLNLPRFLRSLLRGRLSEARSLLQVDVVLRGLTLYPLHLVCGTIIVGSYLSGSPFLSGWVIELAAVWFASILIFLLTSLPRIRFLGEADRYLEYMGFAPATIVTVLWMFEGGIKAYDLVMCCLLFGWYMFVADLLPPPSQREEGIKRPLWNYLLSLQDARLLVLPINRSLEVVYRTNLPCVYPIPLGDQFSSRILQQPLPDLSWKEFKDNYGITHVVVYKYLLREPGIGDHIQWDSFIYEDDEVLLFEIEDLLALGEPSGREAHVCSPEPEPEIDRDMAQV